MEEESEKNCLYAGFPLDFHREIGIALVCMLNSSQKSMLIHSLGYNMTSRQVNISLDIQKGKRSGFHFQEKNMTVYSFQGSY